MNTILKRLSQPGDFPRISIYMPTHVRGKETLQAPIRLKNALKCVQEQLSRFGWGAGAIDDLTSKAAARHDDFDFWQHQSQGLALFIDTSYTTEVHLPETPQELCIVAERFHIRPLIPMFRDRGWAYLLAATRNSVRLTRFNAHESSDVVVDDLPDGIEDLRARTEFDADVGYHQRDRGSHVGGADQPKYHALGESPDDYDDVLLEKFAGSVAKAVDSHLADDDRLPLVLAAMPRLGGRLKQKLRRGNLAATTIQSDPAAMGERELQQAAWAIAAPLLKGDRDEAMARLSAWSNGAAVAGSSNIEDIFHASEEGRVASLFVPRDETVWGIYDEAHRIVRIDQMSGPENEDLLNLLALRTLLQGGEVYSMPAEVRAGAGPTVALFRY